MSSSIRGLGVQRVKTSWVDMAVIKDLQRGVCMTDYTKEAEIAQEQSFQ